MEWTASFKKAINYMEENLLLDISAEETARRVNISSFYFQRGFKIMTGYSISEYIRNRRLYLAGLEVISGKAKVIDLACKYGYDTPESFAKAFARFHGCSPMQLREKPFQIRTFLPLTIEVIIRGGSKMEFQVEKREAVRMIGFETQCSLENSYQELPGFWDRIRTRYCESRPGDDPKEEEIRQVMKECAVGEYGVCIDDRKEGICRYLIAGVYWGGTVPEGMKVIEIPALTWAKFRCTGPMPEAIQKVNTRIYREWLPGNTEYELADDLNIEWYSGQGNVTDDDYESAVWIPVRKK